MKRYLLFTWADHEAWGGWNEFSGDFDTEDEAKEAWLKMKAAGTNDNAAHVIDTQNPPTPGDIPEL